MLHRETNNLAESVMELKHAKKRLEDQNKDLQSQIHSTENSYAMLQTDYKNMCDKLCR
jgi:predicted  nucleic acid-binding Zn-ribbon protein